MAVSAFLLLLAEAPGADAAAPTEWLVGTATGPRAAAAATPGTQIAPGIRVMRAHRAEARRLRWHPGVRWVEPNRRFSPSSLAAPTDAFFRQQWALRDARVPKAWRTSVGGNVIVAVLDTGVDATHPDLAGNLWTNPGELPGNGVDDDGNGFVDDLHGADMVNGDGDPADGAGHGTVPSYPASASPAVVSVASSNRGGRLGYASAYGASSVDIAAPGDNIISTDLNGRYRTHSGTSLAAAYVSGAVALLAAAKPTASGDQLRRALLSSTRHGGHLDGRVAGGQLNVAAAMRRLVPRGRPHKNSR